MMNWSATLALCSVALALPARQPAAEPVTDREAYAVYAALVGSDVPESPNRGRRLVVQRETTVNNECAMSGRPLETDWKPVVDDFRQQNARVRFILPDRDLHRPYIVVPRETILAFFGGGGVGGGWDAFYRRYPDASGYVEMSAVGFDPSKRRAMVYLAHHCGGLCGTGSHQLMEKVNGAWRPASVPGVSTCAWIS